MRRQHLIASTALATTLLASACALPPPRLDVEEQWGEAIANLGMFPIYPPSEDVMVGDAFLHVPEAQHFNLVRLTAAPRTPLAQQFCFQERDRLVSDRFTGGTSGAVNPGAECSDRRPDTRRRAAGDGAAPVQLSARYRIAPHTGTIEPTHVTRMREAAIPSLEVGRFSEGEIAGAGLLGNFGASLGIGWSAASAIRVELTDLQGVTLDELRSSRLVEAVAVERIRDTREDGRDVPNALTPLMVARSLLLADRRNGTQHAQNFCRGEFRPMDTAGLQVVLANRVLYAGKIRFNFMSNSVAVARLGLDFASALANMPQAPVVPGLPTAGGGGAAGGAGGAGAAGAGAGGAAGAATPAPTGRAAIETALAETLAITNRLMALPASTAGQAQARLTAGRFGTLALDQTFERPAAVGMGAALHYPIAEAAVPASIAQIEDVVRFCEVTHGEARAPLLRRLVANYAWAVYLENGALVPGGRGPGAPAAARAAADMAAARATQAVSLAGVPAVSERETSRVEPLRPRANIRVRL